MKTNIYYVYRWIRLDTNTPFYVGKGKLKRAYETTNRNRYFKNIINKTACEVEIVISDLEESEALFKEVEFIKIYKKLGYCEANITNGGEGTSGYKHSLETINKIKTSGTGWKHTPETLAHLSQIKLGRKRQPHSEETRKKMRDNNKARDPEVRSKISKAHMGKVMSPESRVKMSLAKKGKPWTEARKLSYEIKNPNKNTQ